MKTEKGNIPWKGADICMETETNAHKHAKEIVRRLTSRPLIENPDGYYDMFGDEQQMIKIVEKYLSELRQKLGQTVQARRK